MVLADTSKGDIGWKKWVVAGWAFMECILFGGLLYGWGSMNFVLKSEGIYADLCADVSANDSALKYSSSNNGFSGVDVMLLNATVMPDNVSSTIQPGSGSNETVVTEASPGQKHAKCKAQDGNMALCFTISSVLFCVGCAILGHINYKFGTRVTRLISL